MTYEVQEFIQDNIELINANEWETVYDNALFTLDSTSTGQVTQCLLQAGVDPVKQGALDHIPEYYLSDADIEQFVIPSGVKELCEGCFSYSKLTSIILPQSVEVIGPYAFYECVNLKHVLVLGDIRDTGAQAFFNSSATIHCSEGSLMHKYAEVNELNVEFI